MAKRYSKEFMEQTMEMLHEGNRTVQEVSNILGVSTWTIRSLRKKLQQNPQQPDKSEAAKDELKRLRKEIQELKMENAVLKKYAAILSKEES